MCHNLAARNIITRLKYSTTVRIHHDTTRFRYVRSPPGTGPSGASAVGPNALTMQQRTVLERLITRLVTLTSQQNAEVWACVKHDLGLKGDTPLLASHFSAAESNLNQRLSIAQQNHHHRQILAQLSELLTQGNNRQAVSDYIRQNYGQTVLHALTQAQLENVLHLLQNGQLAIPQPQQRTPTLRPCCRRNINTLNQLVNQTGPPQPANRASLSGNQCLSCAA